MALGLWRLGAFSLSVVRHGAYCKSSVPQMVQAVEIVEIVQVIKIVRLFFSFLVFPAGKPHAPCPMLYALPRTTDH